VKVAVIGGVERNERALEAIASSLGHTLEFHGGHVKGRGVDDLHRQVERADFVIVATNVNSHGATKLAKKVAAKRGVPLVMVTSCSPTRLREILTRKVDAP